MLMELLGDAIAADPTLRQEMIALAAFSLEIERSPLVLSALHGFLEAGSLPEGAGLLIVLSEDECTEVGREALDVLRGRPVLP
jgi:hypothetical protein